MIPVWIKPSKHRIKYVESGERLVISVVKKMGRKNRKLLIERQFYVYPEWQTTEMVSFTINRRVLCSLKNAMIELMNE